MFESCKLSYLVDMTPPIKIPWLSIVSGSSMYITYWSNVDLRILASNHGLPHPRGPHRLRD
ncbi:hypothetical protein KFK09_013394 [Dendrobium nobile]|uniref:Uncharacterized protein n=1 Tax=Dendrobium nobile TaxID=94219 RepID=A0A8T3B9H7_DENNO|nr:hypothetical protein KFK09_013394 [Dendrobium nobile]